MPPNALRRLLDLHASPQRAPQESRYLKLASREVLGTGVPAAHQAAVAYVRAHGLPSDLAQIDAWFRASFEEALCATEFLAVQSALDAKTWRVAEQWCASPDTWALADPIAAILVAAHLEAGVIAEHRLRAWARRDDENFWFRRIAIVATTSLNRGLGGPTRAQLRRLGRVPPIGAHPRPDFTLDLLEASIHDTRHFIRLAIGWALRELAPVAPDRVAAFVTARRERFTKAMLNKARLDEQGRRTPAWR
ncbi:MAG: DNA alkylation repair protein [Actinobacteria bacterium]|nr:DNA alkylation repair protein [Actinomycetota bacterium]